MVPYTARPRVTVAFAFPDGAGVFHACYANSDGALRLTDKACDQGTETATQWSQTGPAGPTGAAGATGPAGPTGATGPLSQVSLPTAYTSSDRRAYLWWERGRTIVMSRDLPAGSYLAFAKMHADAATADRGVPVGEFDCGFVVGSRGFDSLRTKLGFSPNSHAPEAAVVVLQTGITLTAPARLQVRCDMDHDSNVSVDLTESKLTVLRVDLIPG